MKDFFGTVIEPGDAVVVARGATTHGRVAELQVFTAAKNKTNDGIHLLNNYGRRCNFVIDETNVISMKSVKVSRQ